MDAPRARALVRAVLAVRTYRGTGGRGGSAPRCLKRPVRREEVEAELRTAAMLAP